ncbi:MAG: long-chain-acyl-CoA synthetase [Nevskia sp.]|nr:long-chain-acyl-CoA synthetase [Nevskia sp.]
MAEPGDRVRLRDVLRGFLRTLPDSGIIARGFRGLGALAPDRAASIGLALEDTAARFPGNPALRFEGRTWTYAEFNAWANRCAAVLRGQGLRAGDSVAILMENRPELLACVAGTVKLGTAATLLNTQQRGAALTHSIGLTRPRMLVAGAECLEALGTTPCLPGGSAALAGYLWDGPGTPPAGFASLPALAAGAETDNPPETRAVLAGQPAFHVFTSGTTGLPKASVMTHLRWLRAMYGLGQVALRLRPTDVLYCCLPLYHNNALTVCWSGTLGAGACLALARRFSASQFWDDIRASGATAFCYIGELCRYLLNRPPTPADTAHRLRLAVGNGLRAEIWPAFQQRFGIPAIFEFYASSESNIGFINSFGLTGTVGYCPMKFAVVEFDAQAEQPRRDARGFLRKVGTGEVGLLIGQVNDKAPYDGYTDTAASEAKLLRGAFRKGDCWFNTGDLVRDQGLRHVQFVDRVGDTFRWKGENVATTEVEAALNQFPGVEEAVVYGVLVPGTEGRAGMAALRLAEGTADLRALAQHLRQRLPAYAVPAFLRLRREHQTTATFKYRKADLKQEGFDPARISDPLYVLLDWARGYEPLTSALHARIGGAPSVLAP